LRLGQIFMNGIPAGEKSVGIEKDVVAGAEMYLKANKKDPENVEVIKTCAALYQYGLGVHGDLNKAIELYKSAIALKDVQSLNNLGVIYLSQKELKKSMELFQQAIDAGNGSACTNLGAIHFFGTLNTPVDSTKAKELFEMGIKRGDVESYTNLGLSFEREKNEKKAIELWQIGAEKQSMYCIAYLGIRYLHGNGVEKNVIKGVEMLNQSVAAMNPIAKSFIDRYEEIEPLDTLYQRELEFIFFKAIQDKNFERLKFALDKGVNVDAYLEGEIALSFCVRMDRFDFFKYLIEKGANINGQNRTELRNPVALTIVFKKRPEYLAYLLQLKDSYFNVNLCSDDNMSLLIAAVQTEQKDVIEMLFKDGRINPGITVKGKSATDYVKDNKNLVKPYLDSFAHYKKSISSGDLVILFNERTQSYLGVPEVTSDNWEIGKLQPKGVLHMITSQNGGKLLNGDKVRIQSSQVGHAKFNYLYSTTSGWGYYDQKADYNAKQFWKLIKLNLLRDKLVDLDKEFCYGDVVKIENCYYPTACLYESDGNLATSYYNADKWWMVRG
jgi:TPR repeat protein/ankyrin repeat protein